MSGTATDFRFFTFQENIHAQRSFQILGQRITGSELAPVGDYTVLDETEPRPITEKKLINLVTLLNGGSDLIDIGPLTGSRLMFRRLPRAEHEMRQRLMFYTYKGEGVSRENALLTLDEGVKIDE